MKVIGGIYKGRKIKGFDIAGTRPTMDRVKESLFATIQAYIPNSIVLDLFSGSGNLGIESLSANASYAYLIDHSKKAINTINSNIKEIGIKNCQALMLDYIKALKYFKKEGIIFDLIFLDPPYKTNYIEQSIKLIEQYNLLSENGLIICESDNIDKIIFSSKYQSIKEKKYGDKWVVIIKQI